MDQAVTSTQRETPATRTYRLAPAARRTTLALLLGVLAIAVYALWTLGSLLAAGLDGPDWITAALMLAILALSPAVVWSLLAEWGATILTDAAGLTFQTVGGVNLPYRWEQIGGLGPAPTGWGWLSFGTNARSAGRNAEPIVDNTLEVPVTGTDEEIRASQEVMEGTEPPGDSGAGTGELLQVMVAPPPAPRIANRLVRWLYQQAYGAGVPLYEGLADRPALLAEIAARGRPGS